MISETELNYSYNIAPVTDHSVGHRAPTCNSSVYVHYWYNTVAHSSIFCI